jgi:hypothetical protein
MELKGAKFILGFLRKGARQENRQRATFREDYANGIGLSRPAMNHYLGEFPGLEPLDELSESFLIVPPLAINVFPLASTT